MQDELATLTAKPRERTGSRYASRVRQAGGLPAIVYGHGQDPLAISLDAKETLTHFSKGEKVFYLDLEGTSETVLLKDLQYDYLGTNIVHADFARVDLDERVPVNVPIHLVGEAKGLKTPGAVLMHPAADIEIECRVANLPDYIEVDVSELEAHDSLIAGNIELPLPTMKLLSDPDAIVAQIVIQAEEKTEEAVEVEGEAQPEVISEKKDDEEESKD